jgi:transcriptional regulator with XRE-family HTH domain
MSHHGEVIRFLRTRRDWTQDLLAQRIGRSREQVARHEAGAQGLGPRTLARYAAAFGLTVRQFAQLCDLGLDQAPLDLLDAPPSADWPPPAPQDSAPDVPGDIHPDAAAAAALAAARGIPFFPAGIPAGERRFFRPGEVHSEHQIPKILTDALRLPYSDIYACRVVGDSMEPTIREGDVILLSSQPVQDQGVLSGMIYALWYNEHLESTGQLKRVKILADGRWLAQSDNPRYDPRVIQPATLAGMDMYLGTIGLSFAAPAAGADVSAAPPVSAPRTAASVPAVAPAPPAAAPPPSAPPPADESPGPIRSAAQIAPALQNLKKRRRKADGKTI